MPIQLHADLNGPACCAPDLAADGLQAPAPHWRRNQPENHLICKYN
jgi:hypothetical protein